MSSRRLRLTTQLRSALAAGGDLDDETLAVIAQSSLPSPGRSPLRAPTQRKRRRKQSERAEDPAAAASATLDVSEDGITMGDGSAIRGLASFGPTTVPPETDYTREVEPSHGRGEPLVVTQAEFALGPPAAPQAAQHALLRSHTSLARHAEEASERTAAPTTFALSLSPGDAFHGSALDLRVAPLRPSHETPATPVVLPQSSTSMLSRVSQERSRMGTRSTPATRVVRSQATAAKTSASRATAHVRLPVGPVIVDGLPRTATMAAAAWQTPGAAAAIATAPLPASLGPLVAPTVSELLTAATPERWSAPSAASPCTAASPVLPQPPPFFSITAAQHQANQNFEDRFFVRYDNTAVPPGGGNFGPVVVGVCDGHGGFEAAAWVADFLPTFILAATRNKRSVGDVSQAISSAFLRADNEFKKSIAQQLKDPSRKEYARAIMHGTCVVVTLFREVDGAWWAFHANLGDCRGIGGTLRPPSDTGAAAARPLGPVLSRLRHPAARLPLHSVRSDIVSDDYRSCAAAVAQSLRSTPPSISCDSENTSASAAALVADVLTRRIAKGAPASEDGMWDAPERTVDHGAFLNVREIRGVQQRSRDPMPVRPFTRQNSDNAAEFCAAARAFNEATAAWGLERHSTACGAAVEEEDPRSRVAVPPVATRAAETSACRPSSPTSVYRWALLRGCSTATTPVLEPALPSDLQRSLRVAGSLTVTRALGDVYLKDPRHTMPILAPYCPYITAAPDVYAVPLTSADRFVVLACEYRCERGRDRAQPTPRHSLGQVTAYSTRRHLGRLGRLSSRRLRTMNERAGKWHTAARGLQQFSTTRKKWAASWQTATVMRLRLQLQKLRQTLSSISWSARMCVHSLFPTPREDSLVNCPATRLP